MACNAPEAAVIEIVVRDERGSVVSFPDLQNVAARLVSEVKPPVGDLSISPNSWVIDRFSGTQAYHAPLELVA